MRALILAGGLGTRLRPLTYTRPKHLLPIANRPHIEHVLDLLEHSNVRDVVLLTSYLASAFEDVMRRAEARGFTIDITHEPDPLGTAGALKNGEHLVGDETFLAFNGDILTDADLGELIAFHGARGAEGTILLTPVENPSAFGLVPTAEDGRVEGFIEKPSPEEVTTNLINAGIYVLEPSVLARVPGGEIYSAERQLFPGMVADGAPLYGFGTDGYWTDIGTPEKYLEANVDALEGRFRTAVVPRPALGLALRAEGAEVASDARVSASCLGPGTVVESGAVVERSVLLAAAKVMRGATVVSSVLGEGASVAPGAKARDQAIADGATFA